MITFDAQGNLGPLIEYLRELTEGLDLLPLAEEIRAVAIQENARARAEGVDRNGNELVPLRAGRPLRPSEVRRRGGTGEPLAPRGEGSRVVTGFVCEVIPLEGGAILVRGSWPSLDFLKYHVAGAGHNPVRDVAGMTPAAMDRVADVTRDFIRETIGLY